MVLSASGALFGLTLDVEMQGCSDEKKKKQKKKIHYEVSSKHNMGCQIKNG